MTIHTSVVIPTRDRRDRLLATLQPVLADSATDEVVVVIDRSMDGTVQLLQSLQHQDERIVYCKAVHEGAGHARRQGAQTARGEIVVMIDDDVIVAPGTVGAHVRHHAQHARAVVVGYMPVRLPLARKGADWYQFYYEAAYQAHVAHWELFPATVLDHFWGGHFSIPRMDAIAIDPAVHELEVPYHEDYLFGLRCRDAGLTGYFDRRLASEHLFDGGPDEFVRDAFHQGIARARLNMSVGSSAALRKHGSSRRARGLLVNKATSSELCARPVAVALRSAVSVAGICRAYRAQTLLVRWLQRVHQERGWRADRYRLHDPQCG
jgi:glycosyltransferase involved in cell wall biosynthesis